MARNRDKSILKGLLRHDLDEDDDLIGLEEEYDEKWKREAQHYPRGRRDTPSLVEEE